MITFFDKSKRTSAGLSIRLAVTDFVSGKITRSDMAPGVIFLPKGSMYPLIALGRRKCIPLIGNELVYMEPTDPVGATLTPDLIRKGNLRVETNVQRYHVDCADGYVQSNLHLTLGDETRLCAHGAFRGKNDNTQVKTVTRATLVKVVGDSTYSPLGSAMLHLAWAPPLNATPDQLKYVLYATK